MAFLGDNGAGKSTLLKMLAGVLPIDHGERLVGYGVSLHYFVQHQAQVSEPGPHGARFLAGGGTPRRPAVAARRGGYLSLPRRRDQFKAISVLSGGERSRVALARMLLNPTNTLLLDEPTNHLDPASVDVLTDALLDFPGTIVFISHDPIFLTRMATRVVEIDEGNARNYFGDYEYYSVEEGSRVSIDQGNQRGVVFQVDRQIQVLRPRPCSRKLNRRSRREIGGN